MARGLVIGEIAVIALGLVILAVAVGMLAGWRVPEGALASPGHDYASFAHQGFFVLVKGVAVGSVVAFCGFWAWALRSSLNAGSHGYYPRLFTFLVQIGLTFAGFAQAVVTIRIFSDLGLLPSAIFGLTTMLLPAAVFVETILRSCAQTANEAGITP
jgi:hypothetical protein